MSRHHEPIGIDVTRTGRVLQRAFDDALGTVGGSMPMWLIAANLKGADHTRQRAIADAIGLEDATLTHHLHRMERGGLVARHREPTDRRNQVVVLTPDGEALFQRMLEVVTAFDRRLRRGLGADEVGQLHDFLARLRANGTDDDASSS